MKFEVLTRGKNRLWPSSEQQAAPQDEDSGKDLNVPTVEGSDSSPSSDKEQPLQQDGAAVDDADESREERVARLQQEVRSGSYEIPVAQLVKVLTALLLRRR